jgi:glutathione reductase (NADPH)
MDNAYDLIVIGSGSGASGAARKCLKAGWKVAMIDERPYGGTCALRGCDMKKLLAAPAEVIDFGERMRGYGVDARMQVVWPDLMAFKRSFIQGYPERFEKGLREAGMETLHGTARFVSGDRIEVEGKIFKAAHILIAAGAQPRQLRIPGEEYVTLSEGFLELDELPRTIVFLGGGMVSMELAHIAARAGAKVTVIESSARPLGNFDADLAALIVKKSEEIGIRFLLETAVRSVVKNEGGLTVVCEGKGGRMSVEAKMAVHGAGRVPGTQRLDLDSGDVAFGKNGVTVNAYMQSVSNSRVYASGDIADTPGPKLTPVAVMESYAAGANMLRGNQARLDYRAVPTALFTVPRLASVGLFAQQAKKAGYEIIEKTTELSGWYTYKRTHECCAIAKVVLQKETQKILGAHLAGGEADELINHFAAAIARGETAEDMKKMNFAYPTAASDIQYML